MKQTPIIIILILISTAVFAVMPIGPVLDKVEGKAEPESRANIIGQPYYDNINDNFDIHIRGYDSENPVVGEPYQIDVGINNRKNVWGSMNVECGIYTQEGSKWVESSSDYSRQSEFVSEAEKYSDNCVYDEKNVETYRVDLTPRDTLVVTYTVIPQGPAGKDARLICTAFERCYSPFIDPFISDGTYVDIGSFENPVSCSDECSYSGQKKCVAGIDAITTCGDYDVDPCLEWNTKYSYCKEGYICEGNVCKKKPASVTCTETDTVHGPEQVVHEGISPEETYIRGNTTIKCGYITKRAEDFCYSSGLLTEYSCKNIDTTNCNLISSKINCDCKDGACKRDPTCTDGIKNNDESDVDCGGSCSPCHDGLKCNEDSDCESGDCSWGTCKSPCTRTADEATSFTSVNNYDEVEYDGQNSNFKLTVISPTTNTAHQAGDSLQIMTRIYNCDTHSSAMYVQCSILNEEDHDFLKNVPTQGIATYDQVDNCNSADPSTQTYRIGMNKETYVDFSYQLPIPDWSDKTVYVYCSAYEQCWKDGNAYGSDSFKRKIIVSGGGGGDDPPPEIECKKECNDYCDGDWYHYGLHCDKTVGECKETGSKECASNTCTSTGCGETDLCKDKCVGLKSRCWFGKVQYFDKCENGECKWREGEECAEGCNSETGECNPSDIDGVILPSDVSLHPVKMTIGGHYIVLPSTKSYPNSGDSYRPSVLLRSTYKSMQSSLFAEVGVYCGELKAELLKWNKEPLFALADVSSVDPCILSESSFVSSIKLDNIKPNSETQWVTLDDAITIPIDGTTGGDRDQFDNYATEGDPICILRANTYDACGKDISEKYLHNRTKYDAYFNALTGQWCYASTTKPPTQDDVCCAETIPREGRSYAQYNRFSDDNSEVNLECRDTDGYCTDTCKKGDVICEIDPDTGECIETESVYYDGKDIGKSGYWCIMTSSKPSKNDVCYKQKVPIEISQLVQLDEILGVRKEEIETRLFADEVNPICVNRVGNIMCADDGVCLEAKDTNNKRYEDNKFIFDAIEEKYKLGGFQGAISKLGTSISDLFSVSNEKKEIIQQFGVCTFKERGIFNALKRSIANAFGLDYDDPTVNYIILGGIGVIILLVYLLLKPPRAPRYIQAPRM